MFSPFVYWFKNSEFIHWWFKNSRIHALLVMFCLLETENVTPHTMFCMLESSSEDDKPTKPYKEKGGGKGEKHNKDNERHLGSHVKCLRDVLCKEASALCQAGLSGFSSDQIS